MGQPIAPAGAQLAVGTYVHVLSRSPKTVTQVPPLQTGITEATSIRGDGKLRSRRLLPSALQLEFPRAVSRCQKFGLARKGLRAGAARRWAASRVLPNVRSTSILSPPYNSNPHTLQAMTSELLSLIWAGCLREKKKPIPTKHTSWMKPPSSCILRFPNHKGSTHVLLFCGALRESGSEPTVSTSMPVLNFMFI